jgi:AcrR family transcriptional regulator
VVADQGARLRQAMTDLVYEVGYPNVTLAKLLARARVNKTAYYRVYRGKEDCFSAAHALAAGEAIRCTETATAGILERRELLDRGFRAFCRMCAERPAAANLALIESMAVGEAPRARTHRSEVKFARLLQRRFSELSAPVALPAPIAVGLISGAARVGRRRLDVAEPQRFGADAIELARWAKSLSDVTVLERFLSSQASPRMEPPRKPGRTLGLADDEERSIVIEAALRLSSERGYEGLDVGGIVALSGVPRRRFEDHFGDLAGCLSVACELGTVAAVSEARAAYRQGEPGPSGVARALAGLTRYLAANPQMSQLMFVDILRPGRGVTRHGAGLLSVFASLIRERIPSQRPPSEQGAEATVGAVWALIRREVERGRVASLPRLAPVLTWFVVAPSWEEPGP